MEVRRGNGNHHHRRPPGHLLTSAVVSGDSDQDDDDESELDDSGGEDIFEDVGEYAAISNREAVEQSLFRFDPGNAAHADELYDKNLDDEDEAYVYRNMRGGVKETVMVRQGGNSGSSLFRPADESHEGTITTASRPMKVFKPRNSDAVLSCPCCFNIVCMDCQRHQRYLNQFRAMFVMGITVDWHSRLIYDEQQQMLVPKRLRHPNQAPPDTHDLSEIGEVNDGGLEYKEGEYFPVQCGNCRTQVAALDMIEEVYHFHGCLES